MRLASLPLVLAMVMLTSFQMTTQAQTYKLLPPKGIAVEAPVREALRQRVDRLTAEIETASRGSSDSGDWRPDVEVLVRSVRLALDQDLFFKKQEPAAAGRLLDEAERRLKAVARGARGLKLLGLRVPEQKDSDQQEIQLLVGGFVSRIDDSVQPYGLVVPAGFDPDALTPYRVDVWLHGRGDTKTEIPFLTERMTKRGQYSPANTLVLHPFGRHCNAFKFAGEVDVLEAIEHLAGLTTIDRARMSIRGFSMGGAGCWHMAVHYPGKWMAANPGAGFVDTIEYRGWDKNGFPYPIDPVRSRLMRWYDVLPWVNNLRNVSTIAYSGEVDRQKKAADRVFAAAKESGFEFPYVIGKGMGHKIDADSATKIDEQIRQWAADRPNQPTPEIDFTTYTLRYSKADWLQVTGLQQHWTPGRVRGKITGEAAFEIMTSGVNRLEVDFRDSDWPTKPVNATVKIDGQMLTAEDWDEAPGIQCEFQLNDRWSVVESKDAGLRKRPGLQGPIDDAFCDRFLFVIPSRPARHGTVERWIDRETKYAQHRWATLMRGKVNVVKDTDVTEEQIKNCHLICFGDMQSNRFLASVADRLPIGWSAEAITVGEKRFDPDVHAAVFCFPNPRQPDRYLVVNSGMTFREFSNVTNSSQIAMLPDWAVLRVDVEDDGIFPGEVVDQGFFDERWRLP